MTGEVVDSIDTHSVNVGSQGGTGSSQSRPSLSFGDGDTGIYESADDTISISTVGVERFQVAGGLMAGANAAGPALYNEAATSTNPTLVPNKVDGDTGIGSASSDRLNLIAGAVSGIQLKETTSHIIQTHEAHVGLTADVGSVQGGLPLLSSYNVISTSASAGDSCTLPATSGVGLKVTIKNDAAANAVDVFPAAGDDLGAGVNTAASLASGASITYLATVVNSTWTSISN